MLLSQSIDERSKVNHWRRHKSRLKALEDNRKYLEPCELEENEWLNSLKETEEYIYMFKERENQL